MLRHLKVYTSTTNQNESLNPTCGKQPMNGKDIEKTGMAACTKLATCSIARNLTKFQTK